jgi:hypothetical protein
MAIDPAILKFFLALVIASIVIEITSRISEGAAWALVGLLILGLLINNPLLIGFINLGSSTLQKGLE